MPNINCGPWVIYRVQPMSNLIATAQVRRGDYIRVDLDASLRCLTFVREAEAYPLHETAEWSESIQDDSGTRFGQLCSSADSLQARPILLETLVNPQSCYTVAGSN